MGSVKATVYAGGNSQVCDTNGMLHYILFRVLVKANMLQIGYMAIHVC